MQNKFRFDDHTNPATRKGRRKSLMDIIFQINKFQKKKNWSKNNFSILFET